MTHSKRGKPGVVVEIKGIHRVRAKGREYHQLRGIAGSRFWRTGDCEIGSAEYLDAHRAMVDRFSTPSRDSAARIRMTPDLVDAFTESGDFKRLKERTRADYQEWARRFAKAFDDTPVRLWEDNRMRGEVVAWRDRWSHSPKMADYAVTVALRILNWGVESSWITGHNCAGIRRLYNNDRAEVIIPPDLQDRFYDVASANTARMFRAAINTGLIGADLASLTRAHVRSTPHGRRIMLRRGKTGRQASIPVTQEMGQIIDTTPAGQMLLLVSDRGRPLTAATISRYLRDCFIKAGFPPEIQARDTRGTAATNLLLAEASLGEIAAFMGWSLRYASQVIDRYVAVAPEMADTILVKLEAAKRKDHGRI